MASMNSRRSAGPVLTRRGFGGGVALTLALAAGFPGTGAAEPKQGGSLKIASLRHPTTLDPITGSSGYDHTFLYPVYDTLVEMEPATLNPRPGLARAWHYGDRQTLVLDLREGVVFHDGTAFDAEVVKFNLERARTGKRSNIKADLASVESAEVTEPLQVTLHLKTPDTSLPGVLSDRAGMMVSPAAVNKAGADFDRAPVGTGPWKFDHWTSNDQLVFVRNEKYWKPGLPYLDQIDFAYVSDVNTGLRSVVAGENHLVYGLSPQQKMVIDRAGSLKAVVAPTLQVNQIYFNYGKAPLNDPRVRRAINLAINRDQFTKVTTLGLGRPAFTLLPKEHWAHDPSITYERDVKKARELLAEAGYPDGVDLTMIGLLDQAWQQRQEVLISMLAEVGIRLKVTRLAPVAALTTFFGERKDDTYLAPWTGRPDPSTTFNGLFAKEAFFNAGRVDPTGGELTKAIVESRAVDDRTQRVKAFDRVQNIVHDQDLFAPLNFEAQIIGHTNGLHGFVPNLLGKPRFDKVYFG